MLLSLGRGMAPAPAPPPILGADWLLTENEHPIATNAGLRLALDVSIADPTALLTEDGAVLVDETGAFLFPDTPTDLTTESGLVLIREDEAPLRME